MPVFLRAMCLRVMGLEHRDAWSEGCFCVRQQNLDVCVCGSCCLARALGWSILVQTVCGQPCPQFRLVQICLFCFNFIPLPVVIYGHLSCSLFLLHECKFVFMSALINQLL